ncbi:hypothetical protein Pfo_007099, partial [Paulownia fortunei]
MSFNQTLNSLANNIKCFITKKTLKKSIPRKPKQTGLLQYSLSISHFLASVGAEHKQSQPEAVVANFFRL